MAVPHYHIEVLGQSFEVASTKGEAYMRTLAAYVDNKMRERAHASKTPIPLRVAIMAALEIADELLEQPRADRSDEHPGNGHYQTS